MIFESLEAAQREAAYLEVKTCSEHIGTAVSCNSCELYGIDGYCSVIAMSKPLLVIETVTGEKCEISKAVDKMRKELEDYCMSRDIENECDGCIFNGISIEDECLILADDVSDGAVKMLYDYYEKKMEEKA